MMMASCWRATGEQKFCISKLSILAIVTEADMLAGIIRQSAQLGACRLREFLTFFLQLAEITGKSIMVNKYYSTGEGKFLFRCDPGMTVESRFAGMVSLRDMAA